MSDPRLLRIDVGPVELRADPDEGEWIAVGGRGGADAASGIAAGWSDWVALAQRVLHADALWREREARGDAWDEGHAAGRLDEAARNPYR